MSSTTHVYVPGPLGGRGGRYEDRVWFNSPGLVKWSIVISAVLFFVWFGFEFEELRINVMYRPPRNGTCEVGEPYIDTWVCCSSGAGYCSSWCAAPSCSRLYRKYDGSRKPKLLANPSQLNQQCCSGPCCQHQTCYSTDDGGQGRRWLGFAQSGDLVRNGEEETFDHSARRLGEEQSPVEDSVPLFLLAPPRAVGTSVDGLAREWEDGIQSGGSAEADAASEADATAVTTSQGEEGEEEEEKEDLEGSTHCSCDSYGTNVNYFTCKHCYEGLVEVTYVDPKSEEVVQGRARSSHHPGSCSGKNTYACAQAFVHEHRNETTRECWFDPENSSRVVFHKGWTVWRLCAAFLAFAVCCLCACCGLPEAREWAACGNAAPARHAVDALRRFVSTRPGCCCCFQRLFFGACCRSCRWCWWCCCCRGDGAAGPPPGSRYQYATLQMTAPAPVVTDAVPIQEGGNSTLSTLIGEAVDPNLDPKPSAPPASYGSI